MSTPFYDLASLVVVPSGYKASKVYAQKPLTTDGQLTFSRASTATRVNSAGLIETVSSNVPRLDYLGSTCPKLQLEPQRTNLALQSSAFDNASWTKYNATVTANTSVSPDGTQNADTVVVTSNGYVYQDVASYSAVSGQSVTISVFAKNQINNFLIFGGATAAGTDVYKIENYGNGWYRHSVVRTFTTTTTGTLQYLIGYEIVGTHIIWGAQIEGSNSAYATSYIPTLGTSVTRLEDYCTKTGISSLIGQTEGTLFAEFTYNGVANTGVAERIFAIGDGTINNRIVLLKNPSLGTLYLFASNGINQTSIAGTSIIGGTHKVAVAYKSGDYAVYFNGASVYTSAATGVPATSAFYLGQNEAGAAEALGGTVNQALVFKTRLTNAQLAELTSL